MSGIDWTPVISAAVALLAAVIVTLQPALLRYLKAMAEEKLTASQYADAERVYRIVGEAVAAANQIGGTNSEKMDMAINYACMRGGVDPDTARMVVEAVIGASKAAK